MQFIADFHIHSKYSRATSKNTDLKNLHAWAIKKGVNILGTGDFTHPVWFEILQKELEPAEPGLFKLKAVTNQTVRFILTTEISCIYKRKNKTRKIHLLIFTPTLEDAQKINKKLGKKYNLKSDGRPILGIDSEDLLKIILDISPDSFIVPAHIWTPWFSLFGSMSGFDAIEECFGDYSKYIFAAETGLSSDPAMNWQLSALDKITLISNSDAHSPNKIGREANIFEISEKNLSFYEIKRILKEKDKNKFLYTIEFYPQEGKYHFDGHRNCDICLSPQESSKLNNICPKCHHPLTIGVAHRVADLSNRKEGFTPTNAIPFKSLIPLDEIISKAIGKGANTKTVQKKYNTLLDFFGSELNILLNISEKEMLAAVNENIAQAITKAREGKIKISPGFDGEYGKVNLID